MAKGYGRPLMGRKGGKGMGMGMPGLNMDMIKQAQKMQADMEKTQAELQEKGVVLPPPGAGGLCHGGRQAHLESPHH